MKQAMQSLSCAIRVARIPLIIIWLACASSPAHAAPFTHDYDALLADLHSRATALSTSTDKVSQQQYKAILKVLSSLEAKPSTLLATDIKNLGTVAKSLAKLFPNDFAPPGASVKTNLEAALQGLIHDVQTLTDAERSSVDALGASSCKDMAEAALNGVQTAIDGAAAAPDFATASKLLGTALKSELKAAASASKCTPSSGGGNGAPLSMKINGVAYNASHASATYNNPLAGDLNIGASRNGNILDAVGFVFNIGATTPGTHALDLSSNFGQGASAYGILSGTITIISFDTAAKTVRGTFSFVAQDLLNIGAPNINVTDGQFNITQVQINP